MKSELLKDIACKRFGTQLYDEAYRFATFLDPKYGPSCFKREQRMEIIESLNNILLNKVKSNASTTAQANSTKKQPFHERFSLEETNESEDSLELNDYLRSIANNEIKLDALAFWKKNCNRWPQLAEKAKKVLGVPASSASVERVFKSDMEYRFAFLIP